MDTHGESSGVAPTAPLPSKGRLQLTGIRIHGDAQGLSDSGLELVGQLRSLTELQLRTGTSQITDVGAAHLGKLPNLQLLNLHASKISDNGTPLIRAA